MEKFQNLEIATKSVEKQMFSIQKSIKGKNVKFFCSKILVIEVILVSDATKKSFQIVGKIIRGKRKSLFWPRLP